MSIKWYTYRVNERTSTHTRTAHTYKHAHSHSVYPLAFLFVVRARHIIAKWLFGAWYWNTYTKVKRNDGERRRAMIYTYSIHTYTNMHLVSRKARSRACMLSRSRAHFPQCVCVFFCCMKAKRDKCTTQWQSYQDDSWSPMIATKSRFYLFILLVFVVA